MAAIKRFEIKRGNAFEKMQKLYDLSRQIADPEKRDLFMIKAKSITILRSDFVDALEKYLDAQIEKDPNYVVSYQALDSFDDLYDKVQSLFLSLEEKGKLKLKGSNSDMTPAKPEATGIARLPKLSLPDFDGRQENWPVFYQLFKRLVHENTSLSDLERINYLVAHLKGTARSICVGILPTEENYNSLFKSLIDRYDHKRAIASTYLDKLLNFKPLNQESEKGLFMFLENFVEATVGLKQLNLPDLNDFILLHIALKKLDTVTVKQFEMSCRDEDVPKFDSLVVFLKEQAKILGRTQKPNYSKPTQGSQGYTCERKPHSLVTHESNSDQAKNNTLQSILKNCTLCSEKKHPFYLCSVFRTATVPERWNIIKTNGACYNCLSPDLHRASSCKSKNHCSRCKSRHHTLLHSQATASVVSSVNFDNNNKGKLTQNAQKGNSGTDENLNVAAQPVNSLVHHTAPEIAEMSSTVLLATAVVTVTDTMGNLHNLRALLDPGSQLNFLLRETSRRLGLIENKIDIAIKGIGNCQMKAESTSTFRFSSTQPTFTSYEITALVVDKITDDLPVTVISYKNLPYIKNLPLADRDFHTPGQIDLLLGAELWPEIIGSRKIYGPPNAPIAFESTLGYILMGKAQGKPATKLRYSFCSNRDNELSNSIKRFWELEDIPQSSRMTPEEEQCEEIFVKTCKRLPSGRFSVHLPFKLEPKLLGSSKKSCLAKFLSLENRLMKNSALHFHYKSVIDDYKSREIISCTTKNTEECLEYFMPHHEVYKPDSTSTPLRIVFNASASTSSGKSLNDLLHVGPKLQSNFFDVFLNFRLFAFAMTADISKMYLQILVHADYKKFQRFFWRSSPQDDIQIFEFNTVVFGMTSSPYIAQRIVRELALLEENNYPNAAEAIRRDMYVDDFVSSVKTESSAINLCTELIAMFRSGGFDLAKWHTNSPNLNAFIKTDDTQREIGFEKETITKVLGIRWLPAEDIFTFKVSIDQSCDTKRTVLSVIAKIFDPLGLVAPVVTYAKLIMKQLWLHKLEWDDPLPETILHQWKTFQGDMEKLAYLKIPRHSAVVENVATYLVGFCDASEKAFGAVVYLIVRDSSAKSTVRMMCAKSKIAPMKTLTIPRLELCSALMLSKLMNHIIKLYSDRHQFDRVAAFTDSTVVLHWIAASPSTWKIFVANRVSKLQENFPSKYWRHIKGEENPADCLSRGLLPSCLVNHDIWFSGPSWISLSPELWPNSTAEDTVDLSDTVHDLEVKPSCLIVTQTEFVFDCLIERFSSLFKLLRSTAYALRFIFRHRPCNLFISAEEIETAEVFWLKNIQRKYFSDIFTALKNGLTPSRLQSLDLFIEEDLIRVGGRLDNADLEYDQKHPVLLPKGDKFVELLIDDCHNKNAHAGPHFIFYHLRKRYWILSARSIIRQRTRKCNICFKTNPKSTFPKMAPLPDVRVRPEVKAIVRCGVDYAGPFHIVLSRHRGVKSQKAYICLFVCLTTKAIHLELVSNLSTASFLDAFKRFLSRRGPCMYIQSDCGSNFIGAKKELEELNSFLTSEGYKRAVGEELSSRRIQWNFNPPAAPHFGGIWEANVKVVKTHLFRVIGQQVLTYEEFNTVLIQIEAIMNSRPLCVLSNDAQSPTVLTPAHFLTLGSTLDHFPSADVSQTPSNRLSRYQLLDQMVQHYWKRWKEEYLQSLQLKLKWNSSSVAITPGTVVILMKENTAPLKWPIGIVEKVFSGKDGVSRVVSVRTKDGTYRRPVVKICPLPTQ